MEQPTHPFSSWVGQEKQSLPCDHWKRCLFFSRQTWIPIYKIYQSSEINDKYNDKRSSLEVVAHTNTKYLDQGSESGECVPKPNLTRDH